MHLTVKVFFSSSRLHLGKSRRCLSITWSMYSSLVVALNICMRATPRSATPLMQARLCTSFVACLKYGMSGQLSTETSRKLSSIPAVIKKLRDTTKSVTVCGRDWVRCEPRSDYVLRTSCFFSTDVRRIKRDLLVLDSNTKSGVASFSYLLQTACHHHTAAISEWH